MSNASPFHKSKAPLIWLFIVVAILSILFFQVSQNKPKGFNTIVVADEAAQDFVLFIDGKEAGQMKASDELGSSKIYAWASLSDGSHKFELKSDGKVRASKSVNIAGKAMIKLDLN